MPDNNQLEREEKRPILVKPYPTSRVFEFSMQQWNWVKYLAKNIEHPKWWIEFVATLSTAIFLSSLFGVFSADTRVKMIAFTVAAICFVPLIIIVLAFWARERNRMTGNKNDLIQYMNEIDKEYGLVGLAAPPYMEVQKALQIERLLVAPETEMKEIAVFEAPFLEPTDRIDPWGCRYLPLEIGNGALEQVTCTIQAEGAYWRAGLKLEEPGSERTVPLVLTDKFFLFHMSRNKDGRYGFAAYETDPSGNTNHFINDILLLEGSIFTLYFDCDYRSGIVTFGVDKYRYTKQLKPSLMRNAFLLAWWDGKGAEGDSVEFADVTYRVTHAGIPF